MVAHVWLTWRFWYEILSALGFGIASSLIPVLNSEIFIVGSLASGLLGPLEVSIGLAIGHAIGKLIMFIGIRQGKNLKWFKHKEPKPAPPGSWRERLGRWNDHAARAVEHPRWGLVILMVSAITGVPPVYLTVIYAATTRMRTLPFTLTMVIGFFLRCYALALATKWGVHLVI
ncbi:hypothetical protein [Acidipropionibacterium timonense]|uniref:hypothetical protein n=1 Tax=Acidipropionibacterium timonense TaxID=2161818 RepID=UPI0010306865|nr:hypothetical protein [Acidipropionibacterium timonense]